MPPFFRPAMMPSPPSATARTAAASVTIENTTSEAWATARGVGASRMPAATNGSAFCLLLLAAVPARHRVARGHEPWDDAGAHGAQPNETDVHASTSQRAALSPLAPSPQPKSDISDFGRLKCRIRASPSSGGEGCSVLQNQGTGEGVRMREYHR